jgi:glycosyltransferase involved in cell wall biosynthesis
MKKKLLIIGSSQGVYGGIEAFMMAIANEAKNWSEFEVRLCFKLKDLNQNTDILEKFANESSSSVHFVKKNSLSLYKLVLWSDILHIQNMPPDIVFSSFLLRKKIFLTIHNRKFSKKSFLQYLWVFASKMATKRWYNSNFVWNSWEPNLKKENSSCIPTVCNLSTTEVDSEKRKGFIFAGRWIENKGIEELILAYDKSKLCPIEWPLTIIGDGPIKIKIMDMISKVDVEIHTPGFVSNELKTELISKSKWLVAPANTNEDLGLTPIEARSMGVPSIVTNDGGLTQAAGPHAIVAIPGDVESLLSCMLKAAQMSEEEYKFISEKSKETLSDLIKPITFYKKEFLNN